MKPRQPLGVKLSDKAKTHIVDNVFRTHKVTYCGHFTKKKTFLLRLNRGRVCRKCARSWAAEQGVH